MQVLHNNNTESKIANRGGCVGLISMSPIPSHAGDGLAGLSPARTPVIRPTALISTFSSNCAQPPSSLTLISPSMTAPRSLPTHATCSPRHHHINRSQQQQQAKALSPSGLNDSMPSLIMPHLYVGNQEQTNRETVNKLNIKYILSLGLLPMISSNNTTTPNGTASRLVSPPQPQPPPPPPVNSSSSTTTTTTTPISPSSSQQPILMPSRNTSRDFKIRIRSNTSSASPTRQQAISAAAGGGAVAGGGESIFPNCHSQHADPTTTSATTIATARRLCDENEGVKQVRSVYCKCINIADNSDSSLSKFFDEAYSFIEEARRKKCNILIHCLAGISRSPTIAIAYLMRLRSLHWKDAYDLVKQCRPQIDPNLNFMGQLQIYNRSLRDGEQRAILGAALGSAGANGCKRLSNAALAGGGGGGGADDQTSAIKSSKTQSCGQSSTKAQSLATSPMTPPAVATTATSLGDL